MVICWEEYNTSAARYKLKNVGIVLPCQKTVLLLNRTIVIRLALRDQQCIEKVKLAIRKWTITGNPDEIVPYSSTHFVPGWLRSDNGVGSGDLSR